MARPRRPSGTAFGARWTGDGGLVMGANPTAPRSAVWPSIDDLPRSSKGSFHIPVGSMADGRETTISVNVIAGGLPAGDRRGIRSSRR